MKLIVSIANWHTNRDQYLSRAIKEYSTLKKDGWRVDIVIYSRFPTKIAGPKVVQGYYEGTDFTWSGSKDLIGAVDDYDLFLYTDDDVLVKFFSGQGEEALEFFRASWCTFDAALAEHLVDGGRYERPVTLSAGGAVCAMRWFAPASPGEAARARRALARTGVDQRN